MVILDPCASNPCRNGGTCIPEGNIFVCECPEGRRGIVCEIGSGGGQGTFYICRIIGINLKCQENF